MEKSEIDNLITILFTFYCDDSFRRKYLRACLKSLNNALKIEDKNKINILVIDGSPLNEASKNEFVFENEINQIDVTYEFDSTQNPNKRISNHLKKFGVEITDIFYCPHHPNFSNKSFSNCNCRKPKNGMILKAKKKFNIDLKKSWMIGDKSSDIKVLKV